jgi:ribosomal protein S18 acetylase RimI-like enzyme
MSDIENKLIRQAKISDATAIAALHLIAYHKDHFTAHFPQKLLKEYFETLIRSSNYNYVYYETTYNVLLGYIIAGQNTADVVSRFANSHLLSIILVLIKNPKFIFEKINDLLGKIKKLNLTAADFRVQVYVTNPKHQRKGVGTGLMSILENDLKKSSIKAYGLSVRQNNADAISFYEKSGFKVENKTKKSIYLIKELI